MATDAFARNPIVHEPTVTGIPPLRAYIRDIWNRRALIWHIARTDMKGEHYDTAIGQFWILLDPLLMAAVYYVVRSALRPGGAGTDRNMLLAHLIWGIFFFYATSKALQSGSRSITSNKGLILNAAFPKAVFPIVALLESVLDFIPTLAVYFVFHALLGQPFGMGMLALPLLIVLQLIFTFGLVLLFAPLTVFFRDTSGFMPYITRVWIYLTPVLYTTKEIPPNFKGWFHFNPLYPFFGALEQVFQGQWPSLAYVLGGAAWAVGMLLVGGVVFLVRERDFATRF